MICDRSVVQYCRAWLWHTCMTICVCVIFVFKFDQYSDSLEQKMLIPVQRKASLVAMVVSQTLVERKLWFRLF